MQLYSITNKNFLIFLKELSNDFQVYTLKETERLYPKEEPYPNEKSLCWERFSVQDFNDVVYEEYRSTTPIKSFFSKAYGKVASYPEESNSSKEKPYCIVGVKSCDLKSFITQDHVFLKGDYVDPNYRFYRENNLIISSDCSNFKSACFCLHLNLTPYPKEGFDLNLSGIDNGFVVEVGSEKAMALVRKKKALFQDVRREQLEKREKRREDLVVRLQKSIKQMQLPSIEEWAKLTKEKYESQVWKDKSITCVECGACTQICPTCHCFLLGDQKAVFGYERFKIWDSCQYNGFARVAGGANPRPKRHQRLRNRYVKKFDYFPTIMNEIACTGCGRCIEACPGKIDMREVFKELKKS